MLQQDISARLQDRHGLMSHQGHRTKPKATVPGLAGRNLEDLAHSSFEQEMAHARQFLVSNQGKRPTP